MIKEAILHQNEAPYIYSKSRNCLVFRIRTGQKDVNSCNLVYWARTNPEKKNKIAMICRERDGLFDYYEVEVFFTKVARYQKYFFLLEDLNGKTFYVNAYGIYEKEPRNGYFEFLYANSKDFIAFPEWSKGLIYYQIFPDRFNNGDTSNDRSDCVKWGSRPTRENYMGGDLQGILQKLPYLTELGVECLYLTPIFEGDFNHKYAITDYFKIDPSFGTKEDFRALVEECHQNKIRIILDGVFNHTGIHFQPFEDVLHNQADSCYKDWFYFTGFPAYISHHSYECVGAYKWMPKLNTSNLEVREFILQVMEYWIKEFGIDGWRLDVADEVDSIVWQEARVRLKEKYPEILLIGETWGYASAMVAGHELDSAMNYVFSDTLKAFFATNEIRAKEFDNRLNHMLSRYFEACNQVMYNLIDSHDTPRFLFLCGGEKEKLKIAAAFQFLFPGSPAIYYGDEIGMSGDNDPDCRKAMQWDEPDESLFEWYKKLITIRKREPAIRKGRYFTNVCKEAANLFGFVRCYEKEEVYAVFNNSNACVTGEIPVLNEGVYQSLVDNATWESKRLGEKESYYNQDVLEYRGKVAIALPPYSIQVIKKQRKV